MSPPSDDIAPGPARAAAVQAVRDAPLDYAGSVLGSIRDRAGDGRFSAGFIASAVRRAITAWALAADGDDTAFAAAATEEAIAGLRSSRIAGQRARVVVRDPRVTSITVTELRAEASPPLVKILFHYSARRYVEDRNTGVLLSGDRDAVGQYVDFWQLRLTGAAPWPWQLTSGLTQSLFSVLGYTFVSGQETPGQYRERTGVAPAPGAGPAGRFALRADFAEHDERLGGSVLIVVAQGRPPSPQEAEKLVFPAIEAETTRRLGEGDWRPTLNYLEVRQLLAGP